MLMLLLLAVFFTSLTKTFGNKKLQTIFPEGNTVYAFYALITGVISVINFLIMTGFNPTVNFNILIISCIYGVLCRVSYVLLFKSLEYNGVFVNDAVSRVGSIIPPIVISALILGEKQSIGTILGGIGAVVAAILPGFSSVGESQKAGRQGVVCIIAILALNTTTTMLTKILVNLEGAESMLSFSLFVNVFVILTSIFSLLGNFKKGGMVQEIRLFKKEHYFLTFLVATMSNLSGYVGRYMLEFVDVIQNTIISSALAVVATVMVALWFKEKLTKRHYISAVLSVISAVLPVVM